MAASSETLKIIVQLQDQASKGLKVLANSVALVNAPVNEASKATSQLASSVRVLGGALAAFSIGYVAKSFTDAAATAENFAVRLDNLLGNVAESRQLFEDLAVYAGKVSYEYKDIMSSAASLAAVMTGGREEIERWMPILTDLAATFNLTMQDTTSQIIRMYTSGAAAADLFRERGVTAMLGFQAGVHYSAKETKKQIVKMWEDPASKFRGMTEALGRTWNGMMSILSDKWFLFRNSVMSSGLFDYIKGALRTLLNYLDKLAADTSAQEWAASASSFVIRSIKNVITAVGWLSESVRGLRLLWQGIYTIIGYIDGAIAVFTRNFYNDVHKLLGLVEAALRAMQKMEPPAAKGYYDSLIKSVQEWKDSTGKSVDYMNGKIDELNAKIAESIKELDQLGDAIPIPKRVDALLKEIEHQAKLIRDATEKDKKILRQSSKVTDGGKAQKYTEVDRIRDEMEKVDALTKKFLVRIDFEYDHQKVKLEEYFTARRRLAEQSYDYELEKLIEIADAIPANKRKDKEQAIVEIYKRQKEYENELLSIESARLSAVKEREEAEKEAARTIKDIHARATDVGGGLNVEIYSENRELEQRQKEEVERFVELEKQGHITSEQLQDLHTAHMLEKEKVYADQRRRVREKEKEAETIITNETYRVALGSMDDLNAQLTSEMYDLTQRQKEETERLLEIKKEGYATEEQMQALHLQHMLEKEQLAADQREAINRAAMSGLGDSYGGFSQMFEGMYQLSGQKSAEFFELYKMTAIAETTISTYQSAQEAYKSLVGIPYVGPGLAVAAAAAAVAAGLGRIAMIQAQRMPAKKMAIGGLVTPQELRAQSVISGGPIRGYSPSDHADNVPVSATAGEFMHPVRAVRYYGIHVMDAIRRMTIPREILEPYINPYVPVPGGAALAAGGYVSGGEPSVNNAYSVSVPLTTVDTLDGLAEKLRDTIERTVIDLLDRELG